MSDARAERKRKRRNDSDEGLSKKIATQEDAQNILVSLVDVDEEWTPVIATTPGICLPSDASFKAYTRARTSNVARPMLAGRSAISESELLLHCSSHPKLDYIAREEELSRADGLFKHYIGVYDSQTSRLELVEARKVVVRGTLRTDQKATASNGTNSQSESAPTTLSARSILGQTFGTKKSQKAIRALTENAITSPPKRAQDPSQKPILDPLASAVIQSMAQSSASMPSREELQAAVDEGKPRPKPNLSAETPADVYTMEEIVGVEVLKQLVVKEWHDAINNGEDVKTCSLFVSKRLARTVKAGDIKRLKALRFLLLLMDWNRCLKPGARGSKKLPGRDVVRKAVGAGIGDGILEPVRRRFATETTLNKWHIDNLMTHICALALSIDNYEVDTHDLRDDLRLTPKEVIQYFQELGCKVTAPTESERTKLKVSKAESSGHKIARLKLPLEFPKNRTMANKKR
ncbi:DNA-directed RNA polymerase I subunit rpa49 [Schaereria dolodes]|nr:DNA-directed RNA polymerase I subunit rpa49 [Schaereria dolodes]